MARLSPTARCTSDPKTRRTSDSGHESNLVLLGFKAAVWHPLLDDLLCGVRLAYGPMIARRDLLETFCILPFEAAVWHPRSSGVRLVNRVATPCGRGLGKLLFWCFEDVWRPRGGSFRGDFLWGIRLIKSVAKPFGHGLGKLYFTERRSCCLAPSQRQLSGRYSMVSYFYWASKLPSGTSQLEVAADLFSSITRAHVDSSKNAKNTVNIIKNCH